MIFMTSSFRTEPRKNSTIWYSLMGIENRKMSSSFLILPCARRWRGESAVQGQAEDLALPGHNSQGGVKHRCESHDHRMICADLVAVLGIILG